MVTAWALSSCPCGGTLYSPPTAGARLCATLARQPAHSSQVRLLCILLAHLLQRQNAHSAANASATNRQLHRDWPTSEPGLAASAPGLSHIRVCAATGKHLLQDRPTSWRKCEHRHNLGQRNRIKREQQSAAQSEGATCALSSAGVSIPSPTGAAAGGAYIASARASRSALAWLSSGASADTLAAHITAWSTLMRRCSHAACVRACVRAGACAQ